MGDIGQKIYDRAYDLQRLGLFVEDIELPKSYKMFRTPRYIAELATRFILSDARARHEFEQHGYHETFEFANQDETAAVLLRKASPVQAIVERIQDYLTGIYTEDDIMVISSPERLPALRTALGKAGIDAKIGENGQGGAVILVDFMNVKGLEREVVILCGLEDLYHRESAAAVFEEPEETMAKDAHSRRLIYVALTRPLEELVVFYSDVGHPFVSELLRLNRKILSKREGQSHALPI